jgi:hypothetical protein
MSRVRWAVALLAGGLGLISGCSSLRDHPWFGRARTAPGPACDAPTAALTEGPILDSGAPIAAPPCPAGPPGVEVQPPTVPGTNGTIRPIPQVPQVPQAQPVPAQPSRRTPGIFIDRYKD